MSRSPEAERPRYSSPKPEKKPIRRAGSDDDLGAYDDSSEEEYSLSGVRLRSKKGEIGRKARVAPLPINAAGVPAAILHPDDRIELDEEETRRMQLKERAAEQTLEVKPFVPVGDPDTRRARSEEAVVKTRQYRYMIYGEKPRLVVEEETGMLLPRDHIVTIKAPKVAVDEQGRPSVRAQTADDLMSASNGGRDDEDADKGVRVHYRRSVDMLQELRYRRLLRQVEQGSGGSLPPM